MRFVKEAIRLGFLMFAGQLVADGLMKAFKSRGHWCSSVNCGQSQSGCCSHQEIVEKEEKRTGRRKSR